jgi:hypothetical protein
VVVVEVGTVVVVTAGAVVVVVFARTVTDADAVLALESPVLTFAMVVNVYAVPAVSPVMVHDPDAPVTVHFAPPGVAVTSYDVGVNPPVGAVTVIVALSSPATTVCTPGVFGADLASTVVAVEAALVPESNVDLFAIDVNVYAVPAVKPVIVHDPDAPVTVHFAPPGVAVTSYDVGVNPPVGGVTVIVALSSPATAVGVPGILGPATLFVTDSGPNDAASAPVGL